MAHKQCNCENTECNHPHGCPNTGGSKRMMYVGRVCDGCAENSDPKYMLPGFRQPKPHHFEQRTDMDVDQIPREDIHPDSPEFEPEEGVLDREGWAEDEAYEKDVENERLEDEYWKNKPKKNANKIMRNKLLKIAAELENPENETLVAAEGDDELLNAVAFSFAKAAEALREVAEITSIFEPAPEAITEQKLEEMAALAEAFEESDDELLQKQAAVLDDILITLGSPMNTGMFSLAEAGDRIAELKKKYRDTKEKQDNWNKVSESVKEIEKAPVYREYRSNQEPLSTRYCPEPGHSGVPTHRVGEHTVKCVLDGRVYNYDEGYSLLNGDKVPGGDVANQSSFDGGIHEFNTFDSRVSRMRMGEN